MGISMTRTARIQDSSNIVFVSFDPANHVMEVEFADGAMYRYHQVTSASFGAIVSADSVGSAFNNLRRKYNWVTEKLV